MNKDYKELKENFLKILTDAERFCFLTTDNVLKKDSIDKLNSLKKDMSSLKNKYISLKNEMLANNLLSMEFMLKSILNELHMWISFSEKKFNESWDFLITAQTSCRNSRQANYNLVLNFDGRS
ncbi:unnamed protein product, partial [marine sediment metagenome]